MNIEKLEEIIEKNQIPKYRIQQIKKAIFQDGVDSFLEISNLPINLRKVLSESLEILPFKVSKVLISQDNQSIKALLILKEGFLIETVLISPKPNIWSACISSQVGCALGCLFCATGKMGLKRNLTSEEISGQVLFWRQYLKKNKMEGDFSNIIFMGMGEPFLNWENVKQSIQDFINPEIFAFRNRAISVSTAGILDKMEEFTEIFPQVNLAISLHFASNEKRNQFMKVNQQYNLEDLQKNLQNYFLKNHRKVFLEYILLNKINDTKKDAEDLANFIKKVGNQKLLHVNLIRYNSIGENFQSSSQEKTQYFKNWLESQGILVTIRKSLGEDISGACGQLVGK